MTDRRLVRAQSLPKRFSNFARTIDRRRIVELDRGRAARLAKARIPPAIVRGLPPQPWLRLTPMQPSVAGKGHLDFWNPSFVGINTVELATFDAAFQKQIPDVFEIVRPSLSLTIDPPAAQSVLELSVFAHVQGPTKPTFEIWVGNDMQTFTVEDGQPDIITVAFQNWVGIQLAVPGKTDENPVGDGGGWAFYELRVTPLP